MEKIKLDIKPNISIKVPVISVIGGPGSGKGTLCELLAKHYGLFHISVGNLLREEAKLGSQLSHQITRAIKAGENVDVDVVLRMLEKKMLQNTSHHGYLLDGFPRDAKHGVKFEAKASATILKKRLLKRSQKSDRIDDNLTTIEKRITIYFTLEGDILKKYASKIHKIPCEKSVKEVFNSCITVLNDYFIPKQK